MALADRRLSRVVLGTDARVISGKAVGPDQAEQHEVALLWSRALSRFTADCDLLLGRSTD
jgi:hypothetical protein